MRSLKVLLTVFGLVMGFVVTLVLALFSSGPTRSNYAFVSGHSESTVNFSAFTDSPLYFVIGVPVAGALIGWVTAWVLIRRGWRMNRSSEL